MAKIDKGEHLPDGSITELSIEDDLKAGQVLTAHTNGAVYVIFNVEHGAPGIVAADVVRIAGEGEVTEETERGQMQSIFQDGRYFLKGNAHVVQHKLRGCGYGLFRTELGLWLYGPVNGSREMNVYTSDVFRFSLD